MKHHNVANDNTIDWKEAPRDYERKSLLPKKEIANRNPDE